MKASVLVFSALMALAAGSAHAQSGSLYRGGGLYGNSNRSYNSVDSYVRRDGTYVQRHYRTNPDSNPYNNWSTQGNTNPFTGRRGYNNPYDLD